MGVDYEKCDGCKECRPTDMFTRCFCCEDDINGLCNDCTPERNCVDDKYENYLCDQCLQNATDEDIKSGADNYGVKNISKILKYVKKMKKLCSSKEDVNKRLQEEIDECIKQIDDLQKRVLKLQNRIIF